MAADVTLDDSSDPWGFIDSGISTGLTVFDNIYSTVSGHPTPTTVTPHNNTIPGGATSGISTNTILILAVVAIVLWKLS